MKREMICSLEEDPFSHVAYATQGAVGECGACQTTTRRQLHLEIEVTASMTSEGR
jgi:hypothetical protein